MPLDSAAPGLLPNRLHKDLHLPSSLWNVTGKYSFSSSLFRYCSHNSTIFFSCQCQYSFSFLSVSVIIRCYNFTDGVSGVLLGTFVSNILTNFWFESYIIYMKRFHDSPLSYFRRFFQYLGVTLGTGAVIYVVNGTILPETGIFLLLVKLLISLFLTCLCFYLIFRRSE